MQKTLKNYTITINGGKFLIKPIKKPKSKQLSTVRNGNGNGVLGIIASLVIPALMKLFVK